MDNFWPPAADLVVLAVVVITERARWRRSNDEGRSFPDSAKAEPSISTLYIMMSAPAGSLSYFLSL